MGTNLRACAGVPTAYVLALCLMSVAAPSLAGSEKPKAKPQRAEKIKEGGRYATLPFVPVDVLPANYRGHNCQQVVNALNANFPPKSEYESTDAYQVRMARLQGTSLIGQVSGGDLFAFLSHKQPTKAEYDADAGTMKAEVNLHVRHFAKNPWRTLMADVIEMEMQSEENYQAQNTYGATARVTKRFYKTCSLAFDNITDRTSMRWFSLDFAVRPEEARQVKERLGVLLIGKLVPPYVTHVSVRHVKPTLNEPLEVLIGGDGLTIRLHQVVVFDKITGKIFATEASFE